MTELIVEKDAMIDQDPFDGFASCPDTRQAYFSQSKQNQVLWMQRSEAIIRECIATLDSFDTFLDIYTFLAKKRHDVAIELKQKTDEGRTDYYGTFRLEGDHLRQSVSMGDGEVFWKWQKKKIFLLAYQLVKSIKQDQVIIGKPASIYDDSYFSCMKERIMVDDQLADYYCITIKYPSDDEITKQVAHPPHLSQIELYDFENKSNFNLVRIEYAPINNRYAANNYQILDHYYKRLRAWQPTDDMKNFLMIAARLSYLIVHMMPVKQGNAGIVEWLLRAIAFNKGVLLGYYNYHEGISWDFKALLTPNIDEYADWFTHKLFRNYQLLDKKNLNGEFKYEACMPDAATFLTDPV